MTSRSLLEPASWRRGTASAGGFGGRRGLAFFDRTLSFVEHERAARTPPVRVWSAPVSAVEAAVRPERESISNRVRPERLLPEPGPMGAPSPMAWRLRSTGVERIAKRLDTPRAVESRLLRGVFARSLPGSDSGRPNIHKIPRDQEHAFDDNVIRYGNFWGWGKRKGDYPASPVDLAARYHDLDYGIADTDPATGEERAKPLGNFSDLASFDRRWVYDKMIADLALGANTMKFMGEGFWHGTYEGRPLMLLGDLVYGAVSMALAGIGVYLRSHAYVAFTAVDVLDRLMHADLVGAVSVAWSGAFDLATAAVYTAWSYTVAAGTLVVGFTKAVVTNPAKAVGLVAGATLGGMLLGPAGAIVGGLLGALFGDGCFIVTAVRRSLGKPDSDPVLRSLKEHRNRFLLRRAGGHLLLKSYERLAPLIVERIDRRADAAEIWMAVSERWLVPATRAARRGKDEAALTLYRDACAWLLRTTGLSLEPKLCIRLDR